MGKSARCKIVPDLSLIPGCGSSHLHLCGSSHLYLHGSSYLVHVCSWHSFFIFFKDLFIYFMYVSTLSLSLDTPEEGIESYFIWL